MAATGGVCRGYVSLGALGGKSVKAQSNVTLTTEAFVILPKDEPDEGSLSMGTSPQGSTFRSFSVGSQSTELNSQ